MGEAAAQASGGLVELSKRNPTNGERDCHRLMTNQLCLALPIDREYVDTKDKNVRVPVIHLRTWLKFLNDNNCLHILAGLVRPDAKREGDIWEAFWNNFKVHQPNHPIFQKQVRGEVQLRNCVGVLLHGDEGRSKKKNPFMILNMHSPLGRGVQVGVTKTPPKRYIKMLPNFLGHSYTNRFLVSAITKADYSGDKSFVFDCVIEKIAEELNYMAHTGVPGRNGQLFAFCLGVVGDWPFLAKAGRLERTFMNVPKHKASEDGGQRAPPKGICHLCRAGQDGWPYEQLATRHPTWLGSMLTQSPFNEESVFELVPHSAGELPLLFKFDIFHVFHLGVAKNFLGSFLALLSVREDGGSIDQRFEQLSAKYVTWCVANRKTPHMRRITKEHLNWVSTTHYPTGSWHKGDLSTNLMHWVQSRFESESETWDDEMLQLAGQAAKSINACLRLLYESGAWMDEKDAREAAQLGLQFLRRYARLALLAHQQSRRLWLVMPKHHALHHLLISMLQESEKGPVMNILCTSVQQDEDFIGRGSRLSRHVSSINTSDRMIDRYLQAAYSKYVEAGYLTVLKGR